MIHLVLTRWLHFQLRTCITTFSSFHMPANLDIHHAFYLVTCVSLDSNQGLSLCRKCMLQAETKITTLIVDSMVTRLNELAKHVSIICSYSAVEWWIFFQIILAGLVDTAPFNGDVIYICPSDRVLLVLWACVSGLPCFVQFNLFSCSTND